MSEPKQALLPIEDIGDFKFWRIQSRMLAKLLKEIIFRWRNSNARLPGKSGKWAAWPIESWCEWTGFSLRQVERALKELVDQGLIARARYPFAGRKFRAYVQPTKLALQYEGRPQDIARLNSPSEPQSGGTSGGMSGGTDLTPFPSLPPKNTLPPSGNPKLGKGKGKETSLAINGEVVSGKNENGTQKLIQ